MNDDIRTEDERRAVRYDVIDETVTGLFGLAIVALLLGFLIEIDVFPWGAWVYWVAALLGVLALKGIGGMALALWEIRASADNPAEHEVDEPDERTGRP